MNVYADVTVELNRRGTDIFDQYINLANKTQNSEDQTLVIPVTKGMRRCFGCKMIAKAI